MATVVDNLIAYRILSLLVTPFDQSEAYKLGVIDEKGNNLIKSAKLTSSQKSAYTYLHRMVFNLKKIISKLPGGESKLKNIVAAFFLLKENVECQETITEDRLHFVLDLLDEGVLFEEQLVVENFMNLMEDAPAVASGGGIAQGQAGAAVDTIAGMDAPLVKKIVRRKKRRKVV